MYIVDRNLSGALSEPAAERVLEFVTKWGRNASPFKIASLYLRLNWKGLSYWRDVSKAAAAGRDLLSRIDGLERGARALKKATDELYSAEGQLPAYPLQSAAKAGHVVATPAELDYIERYFNTAAMIANDAMDARSELDRAISGWDGALAQANSTRDFTRKAVFEAITLLDLRFSNEGGSFRAYLVNARDRAARIESWARMKQFHAAHILGKWTPDWYTPPSPD
jgi:hypothetical protein